MGAPRSSPYGYPPVSRCSYRGGGLRWLWRPCEARRVSSTPHATVRQFVVDEAVDAEGMQARVRVGLSRSALGGGGVRRGRQPVPTAVPGIHCGGSAVRVIQVMFVAPATAVLTVRAALLLWTAVSPSPRCCGAGTRSAASRYSARRSPGVSASSTSPLPRTIKEVNTQSSTTVHNLEGAGIKAIDLFNACFLAIGLYGSIGATVIRWRSQKRWSRLVRRSGATAAPRLAVLPRRGLQGRPLHPLSAHRGAPTSPMASTSSSRSPIHARRFRLGGGTHTASARLDFLVETAYGGRLPTVPWHSGQLR